MTPFLIHTIQSVLKTVQSPLVSEPYGCSR